MYYISSETTAKGAGFGASAMKEDPVELDSGPTLNNSWRKTKVVLVKVVSVIID